MSQMRGRPMIDSALILLCYVSRNPGKRSVRQLSDQTDIPSSTLQHLLTDSYSVLDRAAYQYGYSCRVVSEQWTEGYGDRRRTLEAVYWPGARAEELGART